MNLTAITVMSAALLLAGAIASTKGDPPVINETLGAGNAIKGKNVTKEARIKIRIGAKTFTGSLADNPTADAFKALLPLTLKMSDLHGNEKFYHLPSPLRSNDANPGTIQTGDLMLWNSKSVVLFYKSFQTSHSYTKLGRIDNVEGLSAVVGEGIVTITFALE